MHIAIDDTYGPTQTGTQSRYVTGARRTHVGVFFPDKEVAEIRSQLRGCLDEVRQLLSVDADEFHFADIYNKNGPWHEAEGDQNLSIFEFFAEIYSQYRWPVVIQTIDKRTLADHGIQRIKAQAGKLDLENDSHLSLFILMTKIKNRLKERPEPITMLVDEGVGKAGQEFGPSVFRDWPERVDIRFEASTSEPLLQVADFVAYCVNRCTHLATKVNRSNTDSWFMQLIGGMGMSSDDVIKAYVPADFQIEEYDDIHRADRIRKGLEL